MGGVPKSEVKSASPLFQRYGIEHKLFFRDKNDRYYEFLPAIDKKEKIKELIAAHPGVGKIQTAIHESLGEYWNSASKSISSLVEKNNIARFRRESVGILRDALKKHGILDEYQSAGVFVNWWEHSYIIREYIEYDEASDKNITVQERTQTKTVLKTLTTLGWSPTLIPDEAIKDAFFSAEVKELETLEEATTAREQELSDYIESVEIDEDEDGEEGKTEKTAKSVEVALRALIKDLKDSDTANARKQAGEYDAILKQIDIKDKAVKTARREYKVKEQALQNKIDDRRGTFSPDEAKKLILATLFDAMKAELDKYLQSEVKKTTALFEKLWDKYRVPMTDLVKVRELAVKKLDSFMRGLGYE